MENFEHNNSQQPQNTYKQSGLDDMQTPFSTITQNNNGGSRGGAVQPHTGDNNFTANNQNVRPASAFQGRSNEVAPPPSFPFPQPQTSIPRVFHTLAETISNNKQLRTDFINLVLNQAKGNSEESFQPLAKNFSQQPYYTNGAPNQPIENTQNASPAITYDLPNPLQFFESQRPDFFRSSNERASLRAYLENHCSHLNNEEFLEIISLVENLENQAVNTFMAKSSHEVTLQKNNELAKNKLATVSSDEKYSNANPQKRFTREQIRGMSHKDFKENEQEIFAQYVKGLIR